MKICSKCQKMRKLSDFWKNSRSADKLMYSCKFCYKSSHSNWRRRSVDKLKKYSEEYEAEKRIRPPEYSLNKSISRKYKKYGLNEQSILELKNLQCDVCAICKKECKLVIDHDHSTNKVRGLLCHNCNIILGHAKDDKLILHRAILYLNCNYSHPNRRKP